MPQQILIDFIINNFPFVMSILAIILAILSFSKFTQYLFSYMLFFMIGIGGIWEFALHLIVHHSLDSGPLSGAQFESELAVFNLALGACGLIACFASWSYRAAVVSFYFIATLVGAMLHLHTLNVNQNANNLQIGILIWSEITLPLILVILLFVTKNIKRSNIIYYD